MEILVNCSQLNISSDISVARKFYEGRPESEIPDILILAFAQKDARGYANYGFLGGDDTAGAVRETRIRGVPRTPVGRRVSARPPGGSLGVATTSSLVQKFVRDERWLEASLVSKAWPGYPRTPGPAVARTWQTAKMGLSLVAEPLTLDWE